MIGCALAINYVGNVDKDAAELPGHRTVGNLPDRVG
jgi:hypothetical protein